MKKRINYKKFAEAIEGFSNRKLLVSKKPFISEDDAEKIAETKRGYIKINLEEFLTKPDSVVSLHDLGIMDGNKSIFYTQRKVFEADMLLASYAEPAGDNSGYNAVVCFIYNEGLASVVEQVYGRALKDIQNHGELKC